MAASRGAPSRTGSSSPRRSAPSPSPNRSPTSSTREWAKSSSAATSSRETASTSRPTPDARGRMPASRAAWRSAESASIPPTPTSSTSPRWAIRTARIAERGVFKSTDGGKTWKQRALPQRQDRRGRSVDGSEEPGRALRRILGGLPHAAFALERRPGQRTVQDHRRRQDLDRADQEPGPSGTALGQGRRVGLGRRRQPRLRHHRGGRRRRVPVRRRRRRRGRASTKIAGCGSARSTTRASTPTRRRATRSTSSTRASTARPMPARRSPRSACRTATTTTSGSPRTIRAG